MDPVLQQLINDMSRRSNEADKRYQEAEKRREDAEIRNDERLKAAEDRHAAEIKALSDKLVDLSTGTPNNSGRNKDFERVLAAYKKI